MTDPTLQRRPEPELMDDEAEARAYADADFAAVNDAFVARLLELTADLTAPNVIDLGTGPGDIPIRLARARPDWRLTAVDAAPAMLALAQQAEARAALTTKINWICADAKNTPCPEAHFHIVTSNSILHHVADPLALWREAARLARPGAILFMRDLFRPRSDAEAKRIVHEHAANESPLLQEEFYRSLLSAYTPDEIRQQLRNAGLPHLHVQPITDRHVDIWGTR